MSVRILTGLTPAAHAYQLSKLLKLFPRVLVISANESSAKILTEDLLFFQAQITPAYFSDWDTIPFELTNVAVENSAARISTLLKSVQHDNYCIVSSVPALLRKLIPANLLAQLRFELEINQTYPRDELINKFLLAGYNKVSLVQALGDLALRGNVIDFFPVGFDDPIRLEFFDDCLEKIKIFKADSQRTFTTINRLSIDPLREVYPLAEKNMQFEQVIVSRLKSLASKFEVTMRETGRVIAALRDNLNLPGLELYCQTALSELNSLLDYLKDDTLIVLVDDFELSRAVELACEQIKEQHAYCIQAGLLVPEMDHVFLSKTDLKTHLSKFERLYLNQPSDPMLSQSVVTEHLDFKAHAELSHKLKLAQNSGPLLQPIQESLLFWQKSNYKIILVAGSQARTSRIQELLNEIGIACAIRTDDSDFTAISNNVSPGSVTVCSGQLSEGFSSSAEKLVILAETELFQRRSLRTGTASVSPSLKKILSELEHLTIADFIVHEDFGIGQFRGLAHLTVDGCTGDFLQIEYADSTLYLPAHNINKIQKYLGADDVRPDLDRLSSGKWTKTKAKVQKAVAEIAGDLLNLYAQRAISTGFQFDSVDQSDREFAALFAYDETPDQLSAINDTLSDMAKDKPMDRLVCGDVGFGKTEVAIRAAFKAVQADKQVAILAPTTILVEQHFASFKERFKGLPISVGVLSRFHSNKANAVTLKDLSEGRLDIVVGTHKLLGRAVNFKDLGLLVIDEEHRFGVKQKEYLKTLKRSVDVLTLTATPIPRTLHMAMCQVRDISIISTPPIDRRVIQTHVAQRDENLIRSVLMREHQRGGQAFFVHNRVQTLATVLHNLQELCPELKFAFGHGQMPEADLENTMRRFVDHEVDVLLCTTIIESGLDIPNANTIIIDRADALGLAQLYQLRGRVGRSSQQAYCYFLVPPIKQLNAEAHKRLKALQSLDDLGLGFNLALRDLEIRGAGNILGREQSGSVFLVGYELYSKILNEAIMNLRGQPISLAANIDPEIKLAKDAFLPDVYIPDVSERLLIYQRLSATLSLEELSDLVEELEDRFGAFGNEVQNLVELMKLRVLCRNFGIVKLEKVKERLLIGFHQQAPISSAKVLQLVKNNANNYRLASNQGLSIAWIKDFDDLSLLFKHLATLCRQVVAAQ